MIPAFLSKNFITRAENKYVEREKEREKKEKKKKRLL